MFNVAGDSMLSSLQRKSVGDVFLGVLFVIVDSALVAESRCWTQTQTVNLLMQWSWSRKLVVMSSSMCVCVLLNVFLSFTTLVCVIHLWSCGGHWASCPAVSLCKELRAHDDWSLGRTEITHTLFTRAVRPQSLRLHGVPACCYKLWKTCPFALQPHDLKPCLLSCVVSMLITTLCSVCVLRMWVLV